VSENGERQVNLHNAGRWVQQAASSGAKLVALPELFSGGYWLNERAWDTAEPQDGPTEAWLRDIAQRYGRSFR
jgi:predicted amidohydrolase